MTGLELESLRKEAGISRSQIARALGISERRVYGIERHTATHVTEDLARRWREAIMALKKEARGGK